MGDLNTTRPLLHRIIISKTTVDFIFHPDILVFIKCVFRRYIDLCLYFFLVACWPTDQHFECHSMPSLLFITTFSNGT